MNPKIMCVVMMTSVILGVSFLLPVSAFAQLEPTDILGVGKAAGDGFAGVASAGDVNKDGRADLAIGAAGADPFGLNDAGKIYVFSGATAELLWVFNGKAPNDWTGAMSCAGDVNDDGHDDIIVGVCLADIDGMTNAGKVYILSGANGDTIKTFSGEAAGDYFGFQVCGNVNVDGDGYLDFIIGTPLADPGGMHDAGRVYVFSGKDWDTIYTFAGEAAEDYFGGPISSGDVNDDGYSDIIVGANRADSGSLTECGKVYVFSGKDGDTICTWYGEETDEAFGSQVSATGDVNGDGYADIVVGSAWADFGGMTNSGKVWAFSGKTCSTLYTFHGEDAYDHFGYKVAIAGDVDLLRDGKDDIIIGALYAGPTGAGKAYLFSGATGDTLCVFAGDPSGGKFGGDVSGGGDINLDGKDEVLVGEAEADPFGLTDAGRVYVYSGVTCDTLFTLCAPTIFVTSPDSAECWQVDSVYDITWESYCFTSKVKIEYSTDSGDNWETVVDSTPNIGFYEWTVPNMPSFNCRVRISMVGDSSTLDTSDYNFSIGYEFIEVTSPNGIECWQIGSTHDITWNYLCIPDSVRLEFSTNGGQDWDTIVEVTGNDGVYTWSISDDPSLISVECLVRICDINGDPCDTSDSHFFIGETPDRFIEVRSPNGNECWQIGSIHDITWKSSCVPESVTIQLTTDGGTNWDTIVEVTENDGVYPWSIPDDPSFISVECLVRICAKDTTPCDISDDYFFIGETPDRSIEVNSPNGNECWQIDSTQDITWKSSCIPESLTIELTTDSGVTWDTIVEVTENDGVYPWSIPDDSSLISVECLVRICAKDTIPCDTSDSYFFIGETPYPSIRVKSPNGGEVWCTNQTDTIEWISSCLPENVNICYSTNSGVDWDTIVSNTPNTGSYPWPIPHIDSDQCRVKVSAVSETASDISDSDFTIRSDWTLEVTSPNGGEIWCVDSTYEITWKTHCNKLHQDVGIQISTDGMGSWYTITSRTEDDSSYWWTVPNTPSRTCRIRVFDYLDMIPADTSDYDFTISQQEVVVTYPEGGESFCPGDTIDIKWKTACLPIDTVKIDYSTDSGTSWEPIVTRTEDDGVYEWVVPDTPSPLCHIRVCDMDNDPCNTSPVFTIGECSITVISPNGGEVWNGGEVHTLEWTASLCISDTVRIDGFNDGGKCWWPITYGTPNDGEYEWEIPYRNWPRCLVRVCGVCGTDTLCDTSDDFFSIKCQQVPVLTEFGIVVLILLLVGTAVWMINRRRLALQRYK